MNGTGGPRASDRSPPAADPPPIECWRTIGVSGDRSCPELAVHIHCRNCPVMAEAARTFFDRAAPEGYLDSWTGVLEAPGESGGGDLVSVLVFRLGAEWLALSTLVLVEVTTERTCHRVPHRSDGILAGLVNIRGQLQLCISAHRLLGIESVDAAVPTDAEAAGSPTEGGGLRRLLAIERPGHSTHDRWVFPVDEVAGVQRVERTLLRAVPATVSQSGARFCQSLFDWRGSVVGMIDESRFFEALHDQVRST